MNTSPAQAFSPQDFSTVHSDSLYGLKARSRRPCDSCRRRKSRCEMAEGGPPCVLCRFHRQECTFLLEPLPRKRKAAALNDDENPINNVVNRTPSISQTRPANPTAVEAPKIRQDAPVHDYANLRGPSLLKKTLGLQKHRHSRLIGSTSQYEQILLELDAFRGKEEIPAGLSSLRKVDAFDTAFILAPDSGTKNYEDEIPDLDAIETIVAPHGQALIHLYFRIVHPSFPILHKKVFLEKYQRTHREFSPPLLAAVYILALNWWTYSSELALLPKPDVPRLEKLAFKTMNDIIHRPKLSTLQAGLLLLQRPDGDSWALTTQLVGLGQDLGLHLDCSNWIIPSWERGLRKRLAWALYMQDKWGALVHGRPSHITTTDWKVEPLQEDDFPEKAADDDEEDGSTEVEKGKMLFCEMIKLTRILALVLSNFYTLEAEAESEKQGVRWVLERAKPIQLSLRQWHTELPASLKMESIAMRKLSSTGYLHLGYYAVEITLHRRIIRASSSPSPPSDPSLRSICRQAAHARLQSAMDFVQTLRPEHLQSFWFSASRYCFALVGTFVSLLWATSTTKDEADVYKARLDEYRWLLRLSSKSAEFLERAIAMLATSTDVLVRAIPERPGVEFLAERQARRVAGAAGGGAGTGAGGFGGTVAGRGMQGQMDGGAQQVQGVTYQSESEFHEDTSPENMIGETPSDSGGMHMAVSVVAGGGGGGGGWGGSSVGAEHLWFADGLDGADGYLLGDGREGFTL
ncbi:hypothetical protein BS50DRAFT_485090 [Corynespora cassiicola Philippines]|uniref:Zn(2)-C6 fungal-type domain-containing protein n=1 Tax=Corynespora cassiicola Philippines TaxID=1448308 RepID=A0A2T2P3F6_CORCC|nr:hypothetical protein BS50DRAFT_485090 [Corynespora cassiicola Philippines]